MSAMIRSHLREHGKEVQSQVERGRHDRTSLIFYPESTAVLEDGRTVKIKFLNAQYNHKTDTLDITYMVAGEF